ncbi:MAG TPA: thiamine pyrophosphate-dependent enzyme [Candidatus Eisenbacteria bacterium]|nr:thiamine pyrophosphate-dependent enzyme [Candidatus Eisenbacteria bacterium]
MKRSDCYEFLAPRVTDQLVVGSLSGQRVEWAHVCPHEGNLLVASMGAALGVAVGLSLVLPHRKVIALESDGSLLLSLYNLPTLGNLNPPNLTVFVFDNEVYSGTRISEPSATSGNTDLAAVARACGISRAVTVRDLESFKREATEALEQRTLSFIVCKIEQTTGHRQIPRPTEDLWEHKYRFVRYLEKTEGKQIFLGRG